MFLFINFNTFNVAFVGITKKGWSEYLYEMGGKPGVQKNPFKIVCSLGLSLVINLTPHQLDLEMERGIK